MASTTPKPINWDAIASELAGMEIITEPSQLAKLSLDYYHFSPILQPLLEDKRGDLVVRPTTEAEVLQVAAVCVKYKVPLTVRGAGTGNYGQCIPLQGGVIVDMTRMQAIRWIKPGLACVEPGVKLAALDKQTREIGWELRMAPSTYRTATIGGFIGGGSVGMGSITYGQLRDRGNLHALRVVTLEDEPRVIELRGDAVQKVNHAYGTNGIITELEIPLGPAYSWAELIAVFDDFMTGARFGQSLGDADGLIKKLISIHAWPIPSYFSALKNYLPDGKHCALLMVAECCLEPFQELVREYGGEVTYQKTAQEASKGTSLLEFTWNHTTLHARSLDPTLTYLQTFFFTLERVEQMYHHFGDEVMVHLEFLRVNGKAIPAGLQLVRYSTPERLNEIIQYHEERGAGIANPHTYILEDGGRKTIDLEQLQFKAKVDPYGLMNPGKMRAWLEL
ncbi:MAG TPA: FAD-linked oxidase [Cyanobacteria bacterium UBA8803]|nr:FAD-linked oxidase [Cyanobacteria bacterium UBA9273]HBL58763.1 FAD-linked oxidase [Cyanobacteria bacterium UBA8803]